MIPEVYRGETVASSTFDMRPLLADTMLALAKGQISVEVAQAVIALAQMLRSN